MFFLSFPLLYIQPSLKNLIKNERKKINSVTKVGCYSKSRKKIKF